MKSTRISLFILVGLLSYTSIFARGVVFEALSPAGDEAIVKDPYQSSFRYLIELDPSLLGEYGRILNRGLPIGQYIVNETYRKELEDLIAKQKPDSSPKDREAWVNQTMKHLNFFNDRSKQIAGHLGSVTRIQSDQISKAKDSSKVIAEAINESIRSRLWSTTSFLSSADQFQGAAQAVGNSRHECFVKAVSLYSTLIARSENYRLQSSPEYEELFVTFQIPRSKEAAGLELMNIAGKLKDMFGSYDIPCARFLPEESPLTGALNFDRFDSQRDRLLVLDRLSNLKTDEAIDFYSKVVAKTFQKEAADSGAVARWVWLRTSQSLTDENVADTKNSVKSWINEMITVRPQLSVEGETFAKSIE